MSKKNSHPMHVKCMSMHANVYRYFNFIEDFKQLPNRQDEFTTNACEMHVNAWEPSI